MGPDKLRRLANLAKHCRIAVLVDDLANANQMSKIASDLGSKIGVLIELNLGTDLDGILDRCGVVPGQPAVQLAREIAKLGNIEFRGLMGYEGSLRKFTDFESKKTAVRNALGRIVETKDLVQDTGLNVDEVSCGGTWSYNIASEIHGVTEVQAGSYVFMDTTYQKHGIDFDLALTVLTRAVSKPRPEKIIVDAGLKAISADMGLPTVKGRPEVECIGLNAEHGHFRLGRQSTVGVAQPIELLPTHVDTTVCLHDNYVIVRRGEVETTLEIACRGKLQ